MRYLLLLAGMVTVMLQAQTSPQNYIVTTVPYTEVGSPASLSDANSNTAIQYFDGLGRPVQTVQRAITPTGADLVSGIMYDSFGRDSLQWLPGAVTGNNGAYVANFGTPAVQTNGDSQPYARTDYEPSPLNRVTGQYGPGADWYTAGKKKAIEYTANAANTVKLFGVDGTGLTVNGYYGAATLFGQRTTDEDGKWVEVFTDKLGRKVLSRAYDVSGGNHDTYYVYDDLNNLRYVLPPLASDSLLAGNPWNNDFHILKKYAYLYNYDGRKRCISKRLPGCAWINMVYDNADRLVASQDGNQLSKGQWTVNRYDQFDRLLYSFIAGNSQSEITAAFGGTPANEILNGNATTGGYSLTGSANLTAMLTVNYYDNYNFLSGLASSLSYQVLSGYDNAYPETSTDASSLSAKGLLTGTRVYHLDNPTLYEATALYYDKYNRVVQTRTTNHLNGYDITYNALDFQGKPNKTLKTHSSPLVGGSVTELYQYTYDKAQRLLTTTHQLNGGDTVTLVSNSYDPLGRLQTKTLGGVDSTTYAYNVRSWVTGISGSHFTENLFYNNAPGTIAPFSPNYNGNIGAMKWNTPADGINRDRIYTFGYDDLNRLKDATYSELAGSTVVNSNRYNEQSEYDKMGNITNFVRYGLQSTTPGVVYSTIDDLKLDHTGNQLTTVTEKSYGKYLSDNIYCGDEEFVPNLTNTGNSCAYDANGNRLYDSDANVWAIKYNVLNLPDAMQFYQGHQTYYTYTAAGTKLKVIDKMAPEGTFIPASGLNAMASNITFNTTTTTDYDGSYIYQNDTLKMVLLPEGYWQKGSYYYYLKDHLGSNRVVVQNNGAVVETSSYYPSGMRFGESIAAANNSVQPYRHTGHEMQEMHGLNWIDNGARFRSVTVPEFATSLDPLAEKYYSISPYAYCLNNPVRLIDPNGMNVYQLDARGNITLFIKNEDKIDQLTAINDQNKIVSIDINKGILDNKKTYTKEVVNSETGKKETITIDQYSMSNQTEAKNMSDFVMDNSHVEWEHFDFSNSKSALSTSHEIDTERGSTDLSIDAHNTQKNITLDVHSHPHGTEIPSGVKIGGQPGDMESVQYIKTTSPNVKAYIYLPHYTKSPYLLVPYDELGVRSYDTNELIKK